MTRRPPRSTRTDTLFPDTTLFRSNYLSDAEGFDLRMMVECAKVSREIFAQPAFDPYRGAPIFPARDGLSDAELADFIRAKAETVYHPVGTCRLRSEERRVGKECVSTCRSRWSPDH